MFHFLRDHVLSLNCVSKAMAVSTRTCSGSRVECCIAARCPLAVSSAVRLRLQYIQTWAHNPPRNPSQQGESSNLKTLQLTDRRIEWTRPPDGTLTTPVTLLHPVFGRFIDDYNTHEPTSKDNAFVSDLSFQMSKFFDNETQRQEAFIDILRSHSIRIVPSSFAGDHTAGDLYVDDRRYMILEVKSEVGSEGAEPYCQAVLRYIGVNKNEVEKASMKDVHFNFPCLIITLFGGFCSKTAPRPLMKHYRPSPRFLGCSLG